MLFTLGRAKLSIQKAIDKSISRSFIFDADVTLKDATTDWRATAMKCRAVCGSYSNGQITTGQIQGRRGSRHYVAVAGYVQPYLPSVLYYESNIDQSDANLGLSVDWRYPSSISSDFASFPKYGEAGYGIPDKTMLVFSSIPGSLQAHFSGGYSNQYYSATSNNPGGKYQTWTYTQAYSYCVCNAVTAASVDVNSRVMAPGSSSSVTGIAYSINAPFIAFLRPVWSTATWGVYSTGVGFGSSTQRFVDSSTISYNVTPAPATYRNFPLSIPQSGADETIVPDWAAMVTTLANRRVMLKFSVALGQDIEPIEFIAGNSAVLTVNKDKITYEAPDIINL